MNLWLSSHVLVAGLFLSISALTPEECQPLVTPLSLADPSKLYGRVNFISGYTDADEYNDILKFTDSSWMKIIPLPSSEVLMHQENRIFAGHDIQLLRYADDTQFSLNGTCFTSITNATIDGNTARASIANITTEFHLLPTCDGCLLLSANSTARGLDKFLRFVNLNNTITGREVVSRALYLFAKESTVKDLDLEHFKKQASCLGFSGEPDFLYDPKKGFCEEGEGIRLKLD